MDLRQLSQQDVNRLLPARKQDTHKGDYGKILLLCGSRGYTGAATLAALGALRSGSGLVYLAVPESIYAIEAVKLTEPVILPLEDKDGTYASTAINSIKRLLIGKDAVLIGPGIGQSAGTEAVVRFVLETFDGPVVLDADGINIIAKHMDILRSRTSPTILTPHDGEYRRMGGILNDDRLTSAISFAKDHNSILLLKGHKTIITDSNVAYQNPTGNPGMATGGSGDVLAGMITSLLGQGLPPLEAAACAAWLHGFAGDICASEIGQYGMLPSDMLNVLPRLLP